MRISHNTYVLIMAGGVGSRFWPKSRNSFPKQFIDILGTGESLLQLTYKRFSRICEASNIYVLTNEAYAHLVSEQLGITSKQILVEPCRNNTAPCLAYANAKINKLNSNARIVVAPSDHLIIKEDEFLKKIDVALNFAENNEALITLGIKPTRPDTGYGYIKYQQASAEIKKVDSFTEKPPSALARQYIQSGDYLWNAGIFIWSTTSLNNALANYAPSIYNLFNQGIDFYGTDQEVLFIKENYVKAENISIDFAVMERAANIYTIPADIGWSDLGTWASLHEVSKTDNDNAINSENAQISNTKNCIISVTNHKGILIDGLKDYIVVDDGKVLMIYPKSKEQEIKNASSSFIKKFGAEFS